MMARLLCAYISFVQTILSFPFTLFSSVSLLEYVSKYRKFSKKKLHCTFNKFVYIIGFSFLHSFFLSRISSAMSSFTFVFFFVPYKYNTDEEYNLFYFSHSLRILVNLLPHPTFCCIFV